MDSIRVLAAASSKLVVVDPLMAFLPSATNRFRDHDVRRLLAPLTKLAQRTGAAIVVVRHLNKLAGGNPIYRGGGSIGIIAAARSGLLVAKDPDDPEGQRRVLASTKCNLAAEPPSLAYRLEAAPNGAVRVAWLGQSAHTAASVLAQQVDPDEERSALEDAQDVLKAILAHGPVESKTARAEARAAGLSDRTIDRAKAALRIVARRRASAATGAGSGASRRT